MVCIRMLRTLFIMSVPEAKEAMGIRLTDEQIIELANAFLDAEEAEEAERAKRSRT